MPKTEDIAEAAVRSATTRGQINKPDTALEVAAMTLARADNVSGRIASLMERVCGVDLNEEATKALKTSASPEKGSLPKLMAQAKNTQVLMDLAEQALGRLEEDLL